MIPDRLRSTPFVLFTLLAPALLVIGPALAATACAAAADTETKPTATGDAARSFPAAGGWPEVKGVEVSQGELTLPWYTATYQYQENPGGNRPLYPVRDSRRFEGERTLETVVLENAFIRIVIIPELGGVVARAIDKTTGYDHFFWEGRARDWLPWWESGVKVSFPFYEHGLGMNQPASWHVLEHEDGSVTLAMWMEFSRHNQAFHRWRYGRYSAMPLTQRVTLRPGDATFQVTYGIFNPLPWRKGKRLWNDVYYPRSHTAEGQVHGTDTPPMPTSTEWVYPTLYWSDHNGHGFGRYSEAMNRIGQRSGAGSFSVFSWDIPYGFSGLYYPEVKVNRLRLFDSDVAPGNKQWYIADGRFNPEGDARHMYNYVELWGGTDNVFEGVERWLMPGQRYEMTHHFALIHGMGRVDYANEHVGLRLVNAENGEGDGGGGQQGAGQQGTGPRLELAALQQVANLAVELDGRPLDAPPEAAAGVAMSIDLPEGTRRGRFTIRFDDRMVADITLPLELPDDTSAHDRIWQSMRGRHAREMRGNADNHGNNFRGALRDYPEGSADRGRVLLRDGRIEEAVTALGRALGANSQDGEAWHLLGAAMLEQDEMDEEVVLRYLSRALGARQPEPAAHYDLAMLHLRNGREQDARRHLERLIDHRPDHWSAKLLHAHLAPGIEPAKMLVETDPADLFAWHVLHDKAQALGEDETARRAAAILEKLLAEPGAETRLQLFKQTLAGRHELPPRLQR